MEIMSTIVELLCNKIVDNLHVEFWENNDNDDGQHVVKINMETDFY